MASNDALRKEIESSFKPGTVIKHGNSNSGAPYVLNNSIGLMAALLITTMIVGNAENLWNDGMASPKLVQNFLFEFMGWHLFAKFVPFAARNQMEPGALAGVGLYACLRGMHAYGLMTPRATQ